MCDYGEEARAYLRAVIQCYRSAPFTPHRITLHDVEVAETWYDRGIPLSTIRLAIGIVGVRMILKTGERGVQTLAYYWPLIRELHAKVTARPTPCTQRVQVPIANTKGGRHP